MYTNENRITPVDRREMLRVKLKSLAIEARYIRREELRTFGLLREELWQHRILVVRSEARATHIAYNLIRGIPLARTEHRSETPPNWRKVRGMLRKYGPASMRKLADNAEPVELETPAEPVKLAA